MGRQNLAILYGRVATKPKISINKDTGEYNYSIFYIDVVRGLRAVGDNKHFVCHDKPLVIAKERDIIEKLVDIEENDIIYIKGVITSKKMQKTSYCPNCKDESGNATANKVNGNILYVTPIYIRKMDSYGTDKKAAIEDVVNNREISNQISLMGTLVNEPKLITTKRGIQFTQYALAINRKFLIRTDEAFIKTDWPYVRSYGEQARNDKIYLKYQAEVIIDGFLQARRIKRKTKCKCCQHIYEWDDTSMEVVPYDVEYVSGYKTREEVEAESQKNVEDLKQELFNSGYSDEDGATENSDI